MRTVEARMLYAATVTERGQVPYSSASAWTPISQSTIVAA
jgi:hypothetical protein